MLSVSAIKVPNQDRTNSGCQIMTVISRIVLFLIQSIENKEFPLDFEVVIYYSIIRRGGLYDKSRYHLRSF